MTPVRTKLIQLFEAEFDLCNVRAGESVVILSDSVRRETTHLGLYAEAAAAVAAARGAHVYEIVVRPTAGNAGRAGFGTDAFASVVGESAISPLPNVVDALVRADFVVDLLLLLHSPEQMAILESGTRILLVQEPPDVLERLFASEQLTADVRAAEALLRDASELRLTSPAGTDVTYRLGQFDRLTAQIGYADSPGTWDHFSAGGLLAAYGDEDGVDGTVVIAPGDALFPFKRYVQSPIELSIERGYITAIDGGADAQLFADYLDYWDDADAYAVSHIGWGLNQRARWSTMATMDMRHTIGMEQRCIAGCVLFSTGPNVDGGGSRNTKCHCDIPLRHCTLEVDGRRVVAGGKLVA
ncbi:2,5-dihydroxypyridine 5,6-dioxygenase [Capillimicrobium parvum]|uniref:2,5-dihydroxypyridine 5,6-dioxygenase n=1 Tax=Capillimicrobium parvum TaxID=2884022 RepID=A0A9E7C022_9ACTN|nr:2,5-dihydroxypyridine 5,6-dioxygenase [Capillimicrobium parvum]UGS35970.1 2,5-dihydroxypyridine 5,6-dioxygenase [Capillimicrobium parvum]